MPPTTVPVLTQDENDVWTVTIPGVLAITSTDRDQVVDEAHHQLQAWVEAWRSDPQVRVASGDDGRQLVDFLARADPYQIDGWILGIEYDDPREPF